MDRQIENRKTFSKHSSVVFPPPVVSTDNSPCILYSSSWYGSTWLVFFGLGFLGIFECLCSGLLMAIFRKQY